jgi:hypothetical protein
VDHVYRQGEKEGESLPCGSPKARWRFATSQATWPSSLALGCLCRRSVPIRSELRDRARERKGGERESRAATEQSRAAAFLAWGWRGAKRASKGERDAGGRRGRERWAWGAVAQQRRRGAWWWLAAAPAALLVAAGRARDVGGRSCHCCPPPRNWPVGACGGTGRDVRGPTARGTATAAVDCRPVSCAGHVRLQGRSLLDGRRAVACSPRASALRQRLSTAARRRRDRRERGGRGGGR